MKINFMCSIIIKKNVLYLTIHTHQKKKEMERELTYNEWVKKFKVSSGYVEPTKYFQGNPSSGFKPIEFETKLQRLLKLLGF